MEWSEYDRDCDACFRNYNQNPRQDPCYTHKDGKKEPTSPAQWQEPTLVFGHTWREDEPPFDFQETPLLLRRLEYLRWLWNEHMCDMRCGGKPLSV